MLGAPRFARWDSERVGGSQARYRYFCIVLGIHPPSRYLTPALAGVRPAVDLRTIPDLSVRLRSSSCLRGESVASAVLPSFEPLSHLQMFELNPLSIWIGVESSEWNAGTGDLHVLNLRSFVTRRAPLITPPIGGARPFTGGRQGSVIAQSCHGAGGVRVSATRVVCARDPPGRRGRRIV